MRHQQLPSDLRSYSLSPCERGAPYPSLSLSGASWIFQWERRHSVLIKERKSFPHLLRFVYIISPTFIFSSSLHSFYLKVADARSSRQHSNGVSSPHQPERKWLPLAVRNSWFHIRNKVHATFQEESFKIKSKIKKINKTNKQKMSFI